MERLSPDGVVGDALLKVARGADASRIHRLAAAIGPIVDVGFTAEDQIAAVLTFLDQNGIRTEGWNQHSSNQTLVNHRAANLTSKVAALDTG